MEVFLVLAAIAAVGFAIYGGFSLAEYLWEHL